MAKRNAKATAKCLLRTGSRTTTELSTKRKARGKDGRVGQKQQQQQRLLKAEEQRFETFPRIDAFGEIIVPRGPLFPLPSFGKGLKVLSSVSDFVLAKKYFKSRTDSKVSALKPPPFKLVKKNIYRCRKHCVVEEDEIPICNCEKWSRCRLEKCLNALCLTECFPEHCPCGSFCENQRFRRSQGKQLKVEKTDGRGWGLFSNQDIKAGEFISEYCGEVISNKEFVRRSNAYHAAGETNWYFLQLSGLEVIDACKKGSLSRFINHSCEPNCETQKWTVLGEVRVGVFAKVDIKAGTELTYDYQFECFGGEKVRCRCGAKHCMQFLGARSHTLKEEVVSPLSDEDDDDRFDVEELPMYDTDEEVWPLEKAESSKKRKSLANHSGSESKELEPQRRRPNKWIQMRLENGVDLKKPKMEEEEERGGRSEGEEMDEIGGERGSDESDEAEEEVGGERGSNEGDEAEEVGGERASNEGDEAEEVGGERGSNEGDETDDVEGDSGSDERDQMGEVREERGNDGDKEKAQNPTRNVQKLRMRPWYSGKWAAMRAMRGKPQRGTALKRLFAKQSSGAMVTFKPLRESVLQKVAPDEEEQQAIIIAQEEVMARTEEVAALTTALRPALDGAGNAPTLSAADSTQLFKAFSAQRLAMINVSHLCLRSGLKSRRKYKQHTEEG